MLFEDIKNPINIEMLREIVLSQLCLFGDRQLLVRPEEEFIFSDEIFVKDTILLCCMSDAEMQEDQLTLKYLYDLLTKYDGSLQPYYIAPLKREFSVGFDGEDGFVEVFNTTELSAYDVNAALCCDKL